MNSGFHFEMPYDDPDRMVKFYRAAFGWETRQLGETMEPTPENKARVQQTAKAKSTEKSGAKSTTGPRRRNGYFGKAPAHEWRCMTGQDSTIQWR